MVKLSFSRSLRERAQLRFSVAKLIAIGFLLSVGPLAKADRRPLCRFTSLGQTHSCPVRVRIASARRHCSTAVDMSQATRTQNLSIEVKFAMPRKEFQEMRGELRGADNMWMEKEADD